jgi:hypothetical protein
LAENALQVIDSGTDLNKATAIAYRSDERPSVFVGHVAMILDCSGSMDYEMDSQVAAPPGSKRLDTLKIAAKELINELAAYDNIDISIIPFSNSANNLRPFRKANLDNAALISEIEALVPFGGTNTGDAIRRAYYQLKAHNATAYPAIPKNFLIVLVDGDTTMCSIREWFSETRPTATDYYMDPGDIVNDSTWLHLGNAGEIWQQGTVWPLQIAGHGTEISPLTANYVTKCAEYFFSSTNFAMPFVIALSQSVSTNGLLNISEGLNAPESNVFKATDLTMLKQAFTSIKNEILNNLWHLNGPKL